MKKINISDVDTSLLKVFKEVYDSGNATAAAKKLALGQSAISHALNRLRLIFGDPLFTRTSHGLRPTTEAQRISTKVRVILELVDDLLSKKDAFNPRSDRYTFRIATTDYFEQTIFPLLLSHLESHAPRVTIISRPTGSVLPTKDLEEGQVDLAIAGFFADVPGRYYQQSLFMDDFVCITRKVAKQSKSLSIGDYGRASHLVVSPSGDLKTKAREQMLKHGQELYYAAGVSSFLSPSRILSHSNLLLTCPRRLAETFMEQGDFRIYELPIKIAPINVVQVWHERNSSSEPHQWLRKTIKSMCLK